MDNARITFVDNLRGLLIILVIMGHCIQNLDADYDHNVVFRYIYSFHMPLFMFVSGFVSYKCFYKWSSIKRRFVQLVIPFVTWAALAMALDGQLHIKWLTQPDNGLWFLWVLFWIGVLQICLSKFSKKYGLNEEIIYGLTCLILISILFLSKLSFGFHLIAWYLPFYCMGVLVRKHYASIKPILKKSTWFVFPLFVYAAYFWMRNEVPTFLSASNQAVAFGYKFIVGILGCVAIFGIFIRNNNKWLYISEIGGGMTLGIYALHQPIIRFAVNKDLFQISSMEFWLQCVILFLCASVLTLLGYWGLSKNKFLSKLFLGK